MPPFSLSFESAWRKVQPNASSCSNAGVNVHKSGKRCRIFGTGVAFVESWNAVDVIEFCIGVDFANFCVSKL